MGTVQFFGDSVLGTAATAAHHEFRQKAGYEELGSENHGRQKDVEPGIVGNQAGPLAAPEAGQLEAAKDRKGHPAKEEHYEAPGAKKVHRTAAKARNHTERHQV